MENGLTSHYIPSLNAHVIYCSRKLAQFDEWSKIAIHVAMDNTVVINDISE